MKPILDYFTNLLSPVPIKYRKFVIVLALLCGVVTFNHYYHQSELEAERAGLELLVQEVTKLKFNCDGE